jgi:hypothetical protein
MVRDYRPACEAPVMSERERCHVCGGTAGARRWFADAPAFCSRDECRLAAAGEITLVEARRRLELPTTLAGDRVVFDGFGEPDPYSTLAPGTAGTVEHVDDAGTVHVRWDDGRTIGLVQRPLPGDPRPFRRDRFRRM